MKAPPATPTDALRKLAAEPAPALFAGPIGAGKTKAAQEIASTLGVELRRVDLGQVVSRHIGETEKNLSALFEVAQRDGVVLLFAEADELFGRRTEVRDAHDRYAAAASSLLAKLEAHPGLAIVSVRDRAALDPAVVRRLRHVIDFVAPGPGPKDPGA